MRVLLSCLQSQKRHPLPAYDFWRPYFVEGCREAGIECLEVPGVDWAEGVVYPPGANLRLGVRAHGKASSLTLAGNIAIGPSIFFWLPLSAAGGDRGDRRPTADGHPHREFLLRQCQRVSAGPRRVSAIHVALGAGIRGASNVPTRQSAVSARAHALLGPPGLA